MTTIWTMAERNISLRATSPAHAFQTILPCRARAFPGFVLMPQMFNIWDSLQVQDVIRIVRLLAARYRIDLNRIYIQGISIGGYGVFDAVKRAP